MPHYERSDPDRVGRCLPVPSATYHWLRIQSRTGTEEIDVSQMFPRYSHAVMLLMGRRAIRELGG